MHGVPAGETHRLCRSDLAFIVMGSSVASHRLEVIRQTWAATATVPPATLLHPITPLRASTLAPTAGSSMPAPPPRTPTAATGTEATSAGPAQILFMADADNASTGAQTTAALRGRRSYWDAQSRGFEGLRLLFLNRTGSAQRLAPTPRASHPSAAARLPAWTLLVDDDSFVNVPHLLRYAASFDPSRPLLIGHALDGVWSGRTFSGGAGMLLSRAALAIFGRALASGAMPLPRRGVSNDAHIVVWARRLQVACIHSNLFSYSALPADARLIKVVGDRLGWDSSSGLEAYAGQNSREGIRRRGEFATAAVVDSHGALDAQLLGAVVVHRVTEGLMRHLHAQLLAQQESAIASAATASGGMAASAAPLQPAICV